ncbi:MAG: 30S ribosomal protein S2 [Candidatus Cloacimonetes bacterium]|nr:30S ribosomal protein S2 [Candidatus Cloacimonadota bacterium]
MSVVEMKSLLEAGVHFGHQTRRWNPKMKKYIFIKRNGIHIIDLKQTLEAVNQAYYFLREQAAYGKRILFVGTKKQASEGIENAAQKCNEFYVNHRWYGGTLTNLKTIRKSIEKLEHFEQLNDSGEINKFTKLEILRMQRKYDKILNAMGGIREMEKLPDAVVIADTVNESNAVKEAQKLGIPIVAIVDTNSDPDGIDYIIPGNDDAMKSVNLICDIMSNAINEGKKIVAEGGDIKEIVKESKEVKEEAIEEIKELVAEEILIKEQEPEKPFPKLEEVSEDLEEKITNKDTKLDDTKKSETIEKELNLKEEKGKPEKQDPEFVCSICGKVLSSKRGLKIHLGLVHQE